MKNKHTSTMKASSPEQQKALASPLRLEIIGLFTGPDALAITDMAARMGRPAGSLYHHVGILEDAGLLQRAGTRPKGKRYEALFKPAACRIEMEAKPGEKDAAGHARRAMAAAFRMAERDLEAALHRDDLKREGPGRNILATRAHMRVPPRLLARLNKHLQAIEELLVSEAGKDPDPTPEDQHLSLTLALLPLRGRSSD
jgi:predicted transcriptional regulator